LASGPAVVIHNTTSTTPATRPKKPSQKIQHRQVRRDFFFCWRSSQELLLRDGS
jgi:hypothetical protein